MAVRLFSWTVFLLAVLPTDANGDTFDRYTNSILAKVAGAKGVMEVKKLTPELVTQHGGKLVQDNGGVLVMVKTNGGFYSKMLVQFARQKTGGKTVPVVLLERVTTYRLGQERAILASAPLVHLYRDFVFQLDLAQVVPSDMGGDLRFTVQSNEGVLEAVGAAQMYLVTHPIPGTESKKPAKPLMGEAFEPEHLAGNYRLVDDGRRTARLTLKLNPDGTLGGDYTSEKTGQKYEVTGKLSAEKHRFEFTVKFPQSVQTFQAWAFTKDAGALCGWTKLQEREFGFYAVRGTEE
jgi:hypothetical protein